MFPGRVEGVRGVPYSDYLVAQQGQLWVTNRRKADGNVVSVPSPKSGASIETHNGTLKDSFHMSYDSDHGRVRIYPWMNRGLLERVLSDACRRPPQGPAAAD